MSFLSPASGANYLGTRFLRQVHVRVGQQQFAGVRGSLWISRTYTVHEQTPAGYAANPDQDILVNNTATCEDDPYAGETANFYNTPLTNLSVSVDSQVDDGTASTSNDVHRRSGRRLLFPPTDGLLVGVQPGDRAASRVLPGRDARLPASRGPAGREVAGGW